MTVLELSDPGGVTLELFNAQTLTSDTEGQVDATPFPGGDSDEVFLTSLEQAGRATIQGATTGLRLASLSAYSNDPLTALAEWAATFEAFVNGAQGDGYDLGRDYRGDTFRGYVEDAEWSRRAGEKLEVGWSLSFVRGQGVGVKAPVQADSVAPGGSYVLDGETLPNITEIAVRKEQDVSQVRRTFAETPADNDLFSDSGATRTVTITGQVVGDEAARNAFDASITDSVGQDTLVGLRDAFTGRTYSGMINSYEATDEAGRTRLGSYGIEFTEGTE